MSTETLESLSELCAGNGRVCPQPDRWNELWESLPERRRVGAKWEPPPPLILAAWWHTSDAQKQARLRDHLVIGVKITNEQMAQVHLKKHRFHGDWNYTIQPSPPLISLTYFVPGP